MSPLERALVMNELKISNVIVQQENNLILFVLNNGTVLQKPIDQIDGLAEATETDLLNFENMGDGILWPQVSVADISLKTLIQDELVQRYKIEIA